MLVDLLIEERPEGSQCVDVEIQAYCTLCSPVVRLGSFPQVYVWGDYVSPKYPWVLSSLS